jgi:YD repeat-containing protein
MTTMGKRKRRGTNLLPIIALASTFLCCLFSTAQNTPFREVSIASPTAAALSKYSDIPVSYHTGIPQVSLPIYTVKEGPLELPISISYHAGGLKVMETASWVGQGFSLVCGGVITRSVAGAADERGYNVNGQTHGHYSDYGFQNYLVVPGNDPTPNGLTTDDQTIARGEKDGEPDLYFFNFGGHSGKFYFNDDRTPVLVPEQDLKIVPNYQGPGNMDGFAITVPDGTTYYFGRTPSTTDTDPIEFTNPYGQANGSFTNAIISGWYLYKVASADGQFAINLSYVPENYSYHTISMSPIEGVQSNPSGGSLGGGGVNGNPLPKAYNLIKNFTKGVRLDQISYSAGTVSFVGGIAREDLSGYTLDINDLPNTEAKPLASIAIATTDGNCKKFEFATSYFTNTTEVLPEHFSFVAGNILADRKRLRLDSITEKSCDGSIANPPYKFAYTTETVPRRLSFGQDHWGFSNGVTNNTDVIPTYTLNRYTDVPGANREPAWPAMRAASLQNITYPTGGSTSFEFEPNRTWVSYNKYDKQYRFSTAVGFDNNNSSVSYQNLNTNTYKVKLNNAACAYPATVCGASVSIIDMATNTALLTLAADGGQQATGFVAIPAAGQYKITMYKNAAGQGSMASAEFTEMVPTLYQSNETVGGLRIKSITVSDGVSASNDMVTNYSYTAGNGQSSGILYARPVYVQVLRNDIIKEIGGYGNPSAISCNPNGCLNCEGMGDKKYFKSGAAIVPMSTTQGNHIGYNEVKVTQAGKGSSVYRYYGSNLWDMNTSDVAQRTIEINTPCHPAAPNYPFAPVPTEFMRGELKYEGHFDEAGQIVKEVQYFPVYQDNPVTTPGFMATTFPSVLGTEYELKTARKTQLQTIETNHAPGQGSQQTGSTVYYESPWHNQPTRTSSTNSTGQVIETKIKYAADFRPGNCDAQTDCWQGFVSAKAACYGQYNQTAAGCTQFSCRRTAFFNRRICVAQARQQYVVCRRSTYTDASNAFGNCAITAINDADAQLKPILALQKAGQNPAIESSNWKGGKLLNASFTQYGYSASPATGVYPSVLKVINLTSPSTDFTTAAVSGNTLVTDSRYTSEGFLRYHNGNTVGYKSKGGIYVAYIWGHNNTLPIVKATGVDHATLKAAYDAVGGNLALLRSHSSLSGALISTYTYVQGVGMVTETDANGKTITYGYDKLLRLNEVRDQDGNLVKKTDYKYQQ